MKKKRLMAGILSLLLLLGLVTVALPAQSISVDASEGGTASSGVVLEKSWANPISGGDDLEEPIWGGDPAVLVDEETGTAYLYTGHDVTTGIPSPPSRARAMWDWRTGAVTATVRRLTGKPLRSRNRRRLIPTVPLSRYRLQMFLFPG